MDCYSCQNCANYVFATNYADEAVVPIANDDRRFCMVEIAPREFASYEAKQRYFEELVEERDNGARHACVVRTHTRDG